MRWWFVLAVRSAATRRLWKWLPCRAAGPHGAIMLADRGSGNRSHKKKMKAGYEACRNRCCSRVGSCVDVSMAFVAHSISPATQVWLLQPYGTPGEYPPRLAIVGIEGIEPE